MELKQIYRGNGEWIGVIVYEHYGVPNEIYRTGSVHKSAADALAACASWWEEREKWGGGSIPDPDWRFAFNGDYTLRHYSEGHVRG